VIHKKVFAELAVRLGTDDRPLKKSGLYARIGDVREAYGGTIDTTDAAYVLASDSGIDLSRHLDAETRDRIREIRSQQPAGARQPASASPGTESKNARKTARTVQIKLPDFDKIDDPFIAPSVAQDAKRMSELYPIVYLFENSIRGFIRRVMNITYGETWWENRVAKRITEKARKWQDKHDKNRWHSKCNADPLCYVEIDDLACIIRSNRAIFDPLFDGIRQGVDWLLTKIDHIQVHRNVVAHNNPLTKDNTTELRLYFREWQRHATKIAKDLQDRP